MDKAWLWKKKPSEKTINGSTKINGEETIKANRLAELERSVEDLNQRLSSALFDCDTKDDLAAEHAKATEEAIAGWEQTKAEAASLKKNLDKVLQERVVSDERIAHLDAALKECMQQLRFVREEQEQRIHDAVTKTTREHDKVKMVFEQKLAESNKVISKLGNENTHLSKIIESKDALIEDLKARNSQWEVDFNVLKGRLESMQKDNNSMNYELRVLEKELEIRTEEREFNKRSNDASHKQHLESVKKIAKLETECQRLRLLVRKRLPGPAALARMKSEVDMLGRDQCGTRNKMIPSMGGSVTKDSPHESSPGSPSKKMNYLIERLCDIEEENKTLKEAMAKKTSELQSSKIMFEAQLAELSKSPKAMELPRDISASRRLSFASEDAESWSPGLMVEMENLRNEKMRNSPSCKTVGSSDISLMDDFVEMEKLAIVSMDKSPTHSHSRVSSTGSPAFFSPVNSKSGLSSSVGTGKELVPVISSPSGLSDKSHEIRSFEGNYSDWVQDILKRILEQNRLTLRSSSEIIEDIKVALLEDGKEKSNLSSPVSISKVEKTEVSTKPLESGMKEAICKIVELIERINQQSSKDASGELPLSEVGATLPYKNSGYTYRVYQWKSTELNHVLRQFVHTCHDLLSGEAEIENFAGQLSSTFEWVMNHCFSLQDVSSMRDTIKKQLDWDETQSETDHVNGINTSSSEKEKSETQIPQATDEENKRLQDELKETKSAKNDLEVRLQSASDRLKALMSKLQSSEKSNADLQTEVEALKASMGVLEEQIESQKSLNEDLNTQLSVVRIELKETCQKFSSLEVELEDRKNSYHKLETTCVEQQLQLESITKSKPKHDTKETQLQNGWEITAASEKLAECQETILNLGKQLKAMASSKDAVILDKVNRHRNTQSSLLEQILAENGVVPDEESPKMKEIICTTESPKAHTHLQENRQSREFFTGVNETRYNGVGPLAIVPSNKKRGEGLSLLKKLLSRRKKDTSRRMSLPRND
ncbi:hypothetical protein ACHQM5_023933 [Ranunculus cassubicifolius]